MVIRKELVDQDWEIYLHSFDEDTAWGVDYRQEKNVYVGGATIFKRDQAGQIVETQPIRGKIRFPHAPFRFGLPLGMEFLSGSESDPSEGPGYESGEGSEPSVTSEYWNPTEGLLVPKEEPVSPIAPPEQELNQGLMDPVPLGFGWSLEALRQWNLDMKVELPKPGEETPEPSNMWAREDADCNEWP
ncbi:uncharacterized protein LOC130724405 [Lotus japonicus]|uniref:uncharacterized protein LOC130724405 n=1 Tax=Lotus japonicus TaxID=34305 RepID=UPI0025891DCB|nr:uncharacterized protein LOC130724405 [Lotus japonicus]